MAIASEGDGEEHDPRTVVRRDFTAAAPGEDGEIYSDLAGLALPGDGYRLHESRDRLGGWRNYTLIEQAIEMAARNNSPAANASGRSAAAPESAMTTDGRIFFAALKNERVHRTQYPTREHARRDIVRYIEFWYNAKRRHSGLQYRTPQQVHNEYLEQQPAA